MISKMKSEDSLGDIMNIYPLCPSLAKTHKRQGKNCVQTDATFNEISFEKKRTVNRSKNSLIERVTADYKHIMVFPSVPSREN